MFVLWAGVERSIFFPHALYFFRVDYFLILSGWVLWVLRVSFHFHFLAVIGAVSCFFFFFLLSLLSISQESRSLYTQPKPLSFLRFFPFLLSLGVLRDQILPAIGYGLCGGGDV